MQKLPEKFADLVIRFRLLFIVSFTLISIFFVFTLRDLKIDTQIQDFIPQKHPFIKVQDKLTAAFGGINQVSLAIEVKQGDIFNPSTLGKVIRITNQLYLMKGINPSRISSISGRKTKHVEADEEGFRISRLLRDVPENPDEMHNLKLKIISNPNVYIRMVSQDFKSTLIQADFDAGISSKYIFKQLNKIIEEEKDNDHNFYLAGRPTLEGWLNQYLPKMLKVFFLTVLVIAVILYLTFRSKRGVILPLLDSSMATLWALGMIKILGFKLDPTTMLAPFLNLALGVSHSLHSMKRYYEEAKDHETVVAVKNTVSSLFKPAVAAVITDGLGFLSLLLIPIATIRHMALVCGLGVLFNFPTSFILTPSLLSYQKKPKILEIRREEKHTIIDRLLKRFTWFSIYTPARRGVIIGFILLSFIGIFGVNRIVIGDNNPGSSHLYQNSPYNISEKFINEQFGGTNTYYIFVQGHPDAMQDVEALKEIDSLQSYLKKKPQVGAAISIVDYIKGLNMAMFAGKRSYFSIPKKSRTVAEYLFLYDISSHPGDFEPVVSYDYSMANIKLDLKDHTTSTVDKIITRTKEWIEESRPRKVKFLYAGGDIGILAATNDIIKRSLISNILIIGFLVITYISFTFGSFFAGLLLLIPLFFSILIIFGVLGFSSTSINLEMLPLASLSMGFGINYGLYIINRMSQEAEKRRTLGKIVKETLLTTGKADFFSGTIVAMGSIVCIFSAIRLQARIGMILGVALLLNMFTTLILIPVLIAIFRPDFIFKGVMKR